MRALGFVLTLAARRLRARPAWAMLAGAGLAVAVAVLVAVAVGTSVARDSFVEQSVSRIPEESRSVRAASFGVPVGTGETYAALDRAVGQALNDVVDGDPTRIVAFRESTIAGHFVGLLGIDGVAPFVAVHSGRLPTSCSLRRCEVLRLRGAGRLPNAPGLRLVEVGRASLVSRELFGEFLAPTDNALADAEVAASVRAASGYHRPPPAPLVVADGVEALAESTALARSFRSYGWVWPLGDGAPREWEIDELVSHVDHGRAALAAQTASFDVAAPVDELRAAERSAAVAGRRMLLVGGEAAALLVAFAMLAARSGRRDLEAARRRLTWYGATREQLTALTVAESGFVAVAGTAVGWIVGTVAGALAAGVAGAPVGAVLRQSVLAPAGLALVLLVVLVSAAFVAASLAVQPGARRGVRLVDLAALAACALVAVALLSGAADEESLATREASGVVLLLVPGLLTFAAAVVVARSFAPLVRWVSTRLRHGSLSKLALVSLGRGGGASAMTVAFLVLAFGLALLAEGYRSTLARGQVEQAEYRVPSDVVVGEDLRRLVPVLDLATPAGLAALAPGVHSVPVLRLRGSAGRAEGITGVTALGLPADELSHLRGWRSGWSPRAPDRLAAAIAAPPADPGGIPVQGHELVVRASSGLLSIAPTFAGTDGRHVTLPASDLSSRAPSVLRFRVPDGLVDPRLVALELRPPRIIERGADAGTALVGALELHGLPLHGWVASGGVARVPLRDGIRLEYRITPGRNPRLRAPAATDDDPPRVLVTPGLLDLAGGEGRPLVLQLGGEAVPVVVAGSVQRFPGVSGDAAIADLGALQTAVGAAAPASAATNEVWLTVPTEARADVREALGRRPFSSLETVFREDLERDARQDPLANGVLAALTAAAAAALVLAALGLVLTMLTDVRDERRELRDLEALGARPAQLRRIVRERTLVVAAAGLVGGAVVGGILALLVTRIVTVTARGTAAEPPLRADFDVRVILAGVALYVAVTCVVVLAATRRMFRDGGAQGAART